MSKIKSYKGLIINNGQDRIRLATKDGLIGYKIIKFSTIDSNPGGAGAEHVTKIYKTNQSSFFGGPGIDGSVDFADNDLLAVATWGQNADHGAWTNSTIFGNEIINQDIFVTHNDEQTGAASYYLELEQFVLDLNESTVATLKNLKNMSQR